MTDAPAWSDLERVSVCLAPACAAGAGNVDIRAGMTSAALMSSMTLANAGLGLVHGLASALGAHFNIPHGVIRGAPVGAVTSATIKKLIAQQGVCHPALQKYAKAGFLLSGGGGSDAVTGCRLLVETVNRWMELFQIPRLSAYSVQESDFDQIIAETDNKHNPVTLGQEEIREILRVQS